MNPETLIEQNAEDLAGDMPSFPSRALRLKNRKHSNSFSHSTGNNGLTVYGLPSSEEHITAAFHKVSLGTGINQQLPTERKNSRKSRNGFKKTSSGMKKCGSKDVWLRAHDEMDPIEMDPFDPEYDSNDEAIDPIAFDFEKPLTMSNRDFENAFCNLVMEFFEHLRPEEAFTSLREMTISNQQKSMIPYHVILVAMPLKTAKCELASELLTFLFAHRYIGMNQMQEGFLRLLYDLPDITLDIPKAPNYLGLFIARAVADRILPANFLLSNDSSLNNLVADIADALKTSPHSPPVSAPPTGNIKSLRSYSGDNPLSSGISSASDSLGASLNGVATAGGLNSSFELSPQSLDALKVAESALQDATNRVKLNSIWGKHCGLRATNELIKHIQEILSDFLCKKQDTLQTESAVRSLEAPHFHHELVYQAILTAIESGSDEGIEQMAQLLKYLCDSVIISYDQLVRGVKRVYAEMPLLHKETPLAYSLLNRFIERALQNGFFPAKLAQERPSKARKRFVSEGDYLLHGC